ncbi:MAG: penicillin-binding transpeptidase domain-containing protein [Eubacteriales bacterium]|nr:penicillin-binding transpeptidase domain-containing protein [Eubacteriales bacterium]
MRTSERKSLRSAKLTKRYFFRSVCPLLAFLFLALCFTSCQNPEVIKPRTEPSTAQVTRVSEELAADPDQTMAHILELLAQDDTRSLIKIIYPLALERYGEEQIVRRNAKIHADLGVEKISYSQLQKIQDSSNDAQVFYTVKVNYQTDYGELHDQLVMSLVWHPEAKAWQLDWTPDIILPKLRDTGSVQIEKLKAKRGEIRDRAGWPLAVEKSLVEVSLVKGGFDESRMEEAEQLLGLAPGVIEAKLGQAWVQEQTLVPICRLSDLKDVDYRAFRELGLSWDEQRSRYYPFGEALAPLIGYVAEPTAEDLEKEVYRQLDTTDLIGKAGLEQIYDRVLRGEDGYRVYISGAYEQSLMEKPAVDGKNIQLSIDAVAQRDVYEVLRGLNYSLTALDPQTGEIILLLSGPAYNPMEFVMGLEVGRYQALLSDPQQPLIAKFQGALTPGSTQKIPTAMIGLANGSLDPLEPVEILGKEWQADPSWGNYYVSRYSERDGYFNLEDALSFSDNIYFARVAVKMGAEAFNQGMEHLGLGQVICPDYPFARSQISNHGPLGEDESILLADTAYGQGELLYNQAHLASIYAALLNDGYIRPATLILDREAITDSELFDKSNELVKQAKIISDDQQVLLRQAAERVVDEQYAKYMLRGPVEPAGKSGTAEVGENALGDTLINSWFAGYERRNPNLILVFTLFDASSENPYESHSYFSDILLQLYGDWFYDLPKVATEYRSADTIPAFKPSRALEEARQKQMENLEEQIEETD